MQPDERWPLDTPEHLADALREQGEPESALPTLVPALRALADWPAPSGAERLQGLLATLTPLLPRPSAVRAALRQRQASPFAQLHGFLTLALAQVRLIGLAFWLVSLLLALSGVLVVTSPLVPAATLALGALSPVLALWAVATMFRSADAGMLEFELACPPGPSRLILARLVVVLAYDVALGLLVSTVLVGLQHDQRGILALTLDWLAPLLFVWGLALVLSMRLPSMLAAGTAYALWLGVLFAAQAPGSPLVALVAGGAWLAVLGLAFGALALLRARPLLARRLPR